MRISPARIIHDLINLWLTAYKSVWSQLGSLAVYLIFLFIFGSLFLHLLKLPPLQTLEMSLFTYSVGAWSSVVNNAGQLPCSQGLEHNWQPNCGCLRGFGCLARIPTLHKAHLAPRAGMGRGASGLYVTHWFANVNNFNMKSNIFFKN